MLSSPLQQDSSPESTPRRVKSLVDIYETCNTTILEPRYYEETSKKLSKSITSLSTTRPKNEYLRRHYQEQSSSYHGPNLELLKFVSMRNVKI